MTEKKKTLAVPVEKEDRRPMFRRALADEGVCAYCDRMRAEKVSFFPDHDASQRCMSGKRSHCSCDTCF